MVRRGNLAVFEGSSISETGKVTPTKRSRPPKLVCMHVTSIYSCINFLSRFQTIEFFYYLGQILKVAKSLKLEKLCPPNLVCMHVSV